MASRINLGPTLGGVPLRPFLVTSLVIKIRVTQANAQEQAVHILLMVRFQQGWFFLCWDVTFGLCMLEVFVFLVGPI